MSLQMRFAHTIRFQIHYVFNIVRVPRHEFRCVDFGRVNPGCEKERRLRFAASGRPDEGHQPGRGRGPYKKAISTSHDSCGPSPRRTGHSVGPAGRGSVRCQSLVDRNALHFEAGPRAFLTSS
jgi:hypothetical protein